MKRIEKADSKHLYEVETSVSGYVGKIEVEADTRAEANTTAVAYGYVVRSINMVG